MSLSDELLSQHIIALTKGQVRIETSLEDLKRIVSGNGQPGLVQKVEDLQANKNWLWGAIGTIFGAGGILEWIFHVRQR